MKKIAITQRLVLNKTYFEQREALDIKWGLLFQELNFLPIILPIEYGFETYFKAIKIDGIILTGGNDLNSLNPSEESFKRDTFEKALLEYACKNNIPIFGICRGMQIIAEYFGSDFKKVENQIGIRHTLQVNHKSKYFEELQKIQEVNSFHNYAINNLSDTLITSATDNNGLIKAIEHKKYKVFGQMWHSERENKFDLDDMNLIKSFFNNR